MGTTSYLTHTNTHTHTHTVYYTGNKYSFPSYLPSQVDARGNDLDHPVYVRHRVIVAHVPQRVVP